ncbi:MAG: family 10 glycosylhydrolase [Acidobacteriota bacterium]|nr:family 10 glycosylhydrolase [Acidobacteriota bacterium]
MKFGLNSKVFAAAFFALIFYSVSVFAQKLPVVPRNTIWVSSTASADVLENEKNIAAFIDKAKQTGFDTVILYTKELNGHVIYPSKIAPRLTEHKGVKYNTDFDALRTFIEECHKRGMRLHAAFDIFTEGNKLIPGIGIGFDKRKDWQSVAYDVDEADKTIKIAPIGEFKQGIPLWMNAALPAVQDYELSIIREVLDNYAIDGVVMDRARWNGINCDFSHYSRERFADYIKNKNLKFPEDVYEIKLDANGKKQIVEGKFYKQWLEWRASVIKGFFVRLNKMVRSAKPKVSLESYVGSWYPIYNDVGVNWASKKHKVPYAWATPDYNKTGYTELVDVLYVGLYYRQNTESEAAKSGANAWRSVEGAAKLAKEVTRGATVVHGVINYGDDNLSPEKLEIGTQIIAEQISGVSIFETSHVRRRNMWSSLEKLLSGNTMKSKK